MRGIFHLAAMILCVAAAGPAAAQGRGNYLPSSSLTFHRYFEPFPRVSSAATCRSRCLAIRQCTGWTWYFPSYDHDQLRSACILGAGLKDSQIGNRPGRTSGFIRGRE